MYRALALTVILSLLVMGCNARKIEAHKEGPHLALDADATEIEALMAENVEMRTSPETIRATAEVAEALMIGSRLYQWLENINATLPVGQKLSFSGAASRRSYSVDEPVIYNADRIRSLLQSTLEGTDFAVAGVLKSEGGLPNTVPEGLDVGTFLSHGRALAHIYALATRWVVMANIREDLITRQQFDVRGYLLLANESDLQLKLLGFKQLDLMSQRRLRQALVRLCMNDSQWEDVNRLDCVNKVGKAESKEKLWDFYKDKREKGKQNYDNFFMLDPNLVREDVKWSKKKGQETLRFPFQLPSNPLVANFLKANVEGEYQIPGFSVEIEFQPEKKKGLSSIEFRPGASARASKGKIVMDSQEPLTEESSQATLRHEFGHLLGFRDCYVEFYDEEISAIVNYQLDANNIMCSQSTGHFTEDHYKRLKEEYAR